MDAENNSASESVGLFSRLKGKLLFGIVLGALVFIGFSIYSGYHDLTQAMTQVRWSLAPLLLILSLLNYFLRYLKWNYYLKKLQVPLPHKQSMSVFFSGLVMVVTPGKMGELLKAYLLKKLNGTPISVSAPIVVAERLTDFIALIILSSVGISAYAFRNEKLLLLATLAGCAVFVIIIGWRRLSLALIGRMEKIGPLTKIGNRLRLAYESIHTMVSPWCLCWTTVLSVAAWFCECFGLWLTVRYFLPQPDFLACIFIYAISTIAGAVSMLPGGLGATELGMSLLLQKLIGIGKAQATAATFIVRVATLWFAVLLGAIVLALSRKIFDGVGALIDTDE